MVVCVMVQLYMSTDLACSSRECPASFFYRLARPRAAFVPAYRLPPRPSRRMAAPHRMPPSTVRRPPGLLSSGRRLTGPSLLLARAACASHRVWLSRVGAPMQRVDALEIELSTSERRLERRSFSRATAKRRAVSSHAWARTAPGKRSSKGSGSASREAGSGKGRATLQYRTFVRCRQGRPTEWRIRPVAALHAGESKRA